MNKKIMSFLLALVLIFSFSVSNVPAFAQEKNDMEY